MRKLAGFITTMLLTTVMLLGQGGPGGGGGGGNNQLAPLGPPPVPQGNPITVAKANLGKALFWEEQMSSTRTVSCGTCHLPADGGGDGRVFEGVTTNPGPDGIFGNADDITGSPGVPLNFDDGTYVWSNTFGLDIQVTGRKAPAATDAAYTNELFWDGRATGEFRDPITDEIIIANGATLESQALGPPTSEGEMGHIDRDWTQVAAQIAAAKPLALAPEVPEALTTWIDDRTYPELFEEAFGDAEVSPVRIAMAIATYERTLISDQNPLDVFLRGGDGLTAQEELGRQLFINRDCVNCHEGPVLSDNNYHFIGVRPQNEDLGRFEETGNNGNRGEMRTPGLRNVALRKNFMRNGRFQTLEEVVDFYNRGGDFDAPNKNNNVRPLNMNAQERAALVAFMTRPLTDPRAAMELPPFDRPTLYTESDRVPTLSGEGQAGSDGFTPQVIAVEPPLVGNPSFTIAVTEGLGLANAVLVIDRTDPGITTEIPTSGGFARETISLQGLGAGAGYASVSLSIPDSSAFAREWFGRWYVEDAGAPNGLAISPVFSFTVFGATELPCPTDVNSDGITGVRDLITMINTGLAPNREELVVHLGEWGKDCDNN